MPYTHNLGDVGDIAQIIGAGIGTSIGGPAGAAGGASIVGTLEGFLGGGGQDKARAQRVAWTLQEAQAGSPTAAAIIMAGPNNVGGNEKSMWQGVQSAIPANVYQAMLAQYGGAGWWPAGQPDFYTDTYGATHQKILSEVAATGSQGVAVGRNPTTGQPAYVMPAGVNLAGQYSPVLGNTLSPTTLILAAAAVGGILLLSRRRD